MFDDFKAVKGKSHVKFIGMVNIPQEAFMSILDTGDDSAAL